MIEDVLLNTLDGRQYSLADAKLIRGVGAEGSASYEEELTLSEVPPAIRLNHFKWIVFDANGIYEFETDNEWEENEIEIFGCELWLRCEYVTGVAVMRGNGERD